MVGSPRAQLGEVLHVLGEQIRAVNLVDQAVVASPVGSRLLYSTVGDVVMCSKEWHVPRVFELTLVRRPR